MIDETRSYLAEIQGFMQQASDIGVIQSYLVEHALVRMYTAFESEIQDVLVERCASSGDFPCDLYVASVIKRAVRSIRINELTGILGGFGNDYKEAYSSKIGEIPAAQAAYDSIVENRHAVAHGGSRSATWKDVYGWWDDALPVIAEFRSALLV